MSSAYEKPAVQEHKVGDSNEKSAVQSQKAGGLIEKSAVQKITFSAIEFRCVKEGYSRPTEIGEDGIGRTLTCIGFRPLPDDKAHAISRRYQLFK